MELNRSLCGKAFGLSLLLKVPVHKHLRTFINIQLLFFHPDFQFATHAAAFEKQKNKQKERYIKRCDCWEQCNAHFCCSASCGIEKIPPKTEVTKN